MNKFVFLFFSMALTFSTTGQESIYNELLEKHVTNSGLVDYALLKKEEHKLDRYLSYLNTTAPKAFWNENKSKAFWINAYNAYTLKLILKNYPITSILNVKKKEKTAWTIPFAFINQKAFTLDEIEHSILRKNYTDPRIHVGINCASISCPKLFNKAFTEQNIEDSLEQLMTEFINDASKNKITKDTVVVSSIFKWFLEDFTKTKPLKSYLNTFSKNKISTKTKIAYLNYDWGLNSK